MEYFKKTVCDLNDAAYWLFDIQNYIEKLEEKNAELKAENDYLKSRVHDLENA